MPIQLEPIQRKDLRSLLEWVKSYEQMVQWSGPWNFDFPLDEAQLARFFLSDETPDGLRRMQFKAVDTKSRAMVGQIGFSKIWDRTSAAYLGPVIVAPAARRAGVGFQMTRELLKIAFEQQELHRVELVVFTFNESAISCYEKAGFQTEGVMRDIVRVGDEYWHWRLMSILQPDYQPGCD